jgi:hypothetical protein
MLCGEHSTAITSSIFWRFLQKALPPSIALLDREPGRIIIDPFNDPRCGKPV